MILIILIVFLSVFSLVIIVASAVSASAASGTTLQSALAWALEKSRGSSRDESFEVRRLSFLSSIPMLHRSLERFKAATELHRFLDQANVPWTTARLLLTSATAWAVTAYAVNLKLSAGLQAVAFSVPVAFAPFFYVLHKRKVRFSRFVETLPDGIDLMVSSLRAGHSLIGAIGVVAKDALEPVRSEFRICFEEQNYGVDLHTAMKNLLSRVPLHDLRIVATAILIQKESGGNLAEVLSKTGNLIRDRFQLQAQVQAQTAQGRLTGAVLTAAPIAAGALLYVVNPGYLSPLFTTPLGQKLIAASVASNLLGFLVIRRIINIRV